MKTERLHILDLLRGATLILIVFFHTSVYNYANIHKIDFSNPPIIIVIISFMILWGGMVILYSGFANTLKLTERMENTVSFKPAGYLVIAGIIYLAVHYLLVLFLGRWSTDFVNNQPNLTAVAASLRSGSFVLPGYHKLFEGSSLSTIALNMVILALVNYLLLRNGGIRKEMRNYIILLATGTLIILGSVIRVNLYPGFETAIAEKRNLAALISTPLISNPYPLIPYLAYGFFGSAIAMMFFNRRKVLLRSLMIPSGLFFLFYGIIGAMQFEKSISTPDYFWYFKTNFELGLFILVFLLMLPFSAKPNQLAIRIPVILWFSRLSLTIYLLETTLSEFLRMAASQVFPSWNQTINGCLLFGGVNVVVWILILWAWKKVNYRYSVEDLWAKAFAKMGKRSSKLA